MYYEEKIIDGVLHYRNMPTGKWTAFNIVQLTERLTKKVVVPQAPSNEEYEEARTQLRLSAAPEAYVCRRCGWPVLEGYCCGTCGDTNPSEPN